MGKKHEKILEAMRRTRAGWKASDFRTVYEGFGFVDQQTGGDTKYVHSEYKNLVATVSRGSGELGPGYARTAVDLIERLNAYRSESEGK